MRLGISIMAPGVQNDPLSAVQRVIEAEKDGFESIWFNSGAVGEPLTVIGLAGRETSRIEMMTAIAVTYTRHPQLMAQQALTTNYLTNGRLVLGLGPSHRVSMERLGVSFDRAAAHVREYVTIVKALVDEQKASFKGEFFNVDTAFQMPWAKPCPVVIAALAPLMLKTAGELADGTVTWLVGLKTLQTHVAPRIGRAALDAGRPAPRIFVGLPVAVCDDAKAGRAQASQNLQFYGNLPVYKRVLDIEGGDPGDVVVVGTEDEVAAQLRAFAAAGATDFNAAPFAVGENAAASIQRTRELLKSLVGKV